MDEGNRFEIAVDLIRESLLKYTQRAYEMLDAGGAPRILDIGCGSGVPTIELARLSGGEVTGVDIDTKTLQMLRDKVAAAGLADRITVKECSAADMPFPKGSFDILWAEGSIYSVGFERGLREWKRFLKPGGYMMVHDEKGNVQKKLDIINSCGYELLDYFILDKDTWWKEYFAPLERMILETQDDYAGDTAAMEAIKTAKQDIETFKKDIRHSSSVCFVMKLKE